MARHPSKDLEIALLGERYDRAPVGTANAPGGGDAQGLNLMDRDLHWNSWELAHPFLIVTYRDGEASAHVRYGGREATLPADCRRKSEVRYYGDSPRIIDNGEDQQIIMFNQ